MITTTELQTIFKDQLDLNAKKLYFALIENGNTTMLYHDSNDLNGIVSIVEGYTHTGNYTNCPKFEK
jgi:hypothetical protein